MKKTAIGHVECPVCGFGDAEVKEDKNDQAYIHCVDCNAQVFTRNAFRDKKLRDRMRPVTVTVREPAATAPPVPLPTEAPPAAPAARPAPPAPTAAPTPPPKPAPKPGWFQPLLAK
ncbi:hypothetical protein [Pseudoduganella namucuonensis]|uniref:hypothetical protein n=1 Tax=Pseudoduganella namucuonensis TaxID=1035707 RepID=UPI0011606A8A|nr:hypothetical protein [Pseudoduganella namucuonensis]